jgi:hypothetical protein
MNRLQKTKHPDGTSGWQWDCGPIFTGEVGRSRAVSYGQATQFLEDLRELAKLEAAHRSVTQELTILNKSR